MREFRADLHIHSRHSRATSKALTPANLAAWARIKGIDVLGTGDFTHPGWMAEITDALVEDDSGLLHVKSEAGLSREVPAMGGVLPPGRTRFMLQAEIASIYKHDGATRKIHTLVYVPTLEAARKLTAKLDAVGNLTADGRPILGLPARDLLEMVLETDPRAFMVPAHIWTPWFSLFGSKSGYNHIDECFGDLAGEIFALETGLSSDPDMNRMISALDRFRLISNSDAHSGEKLGREMNIFSGELSYDTIYRALRGEGLQKLTGTIEFFPEEGKYHLDGHRKCGVLMEPSETMARGNVCPVCGKPLTVGVLHRVLELADRSAPENPSHQPPFNMLVPFKELIAETLSCGVNTKKVATAYAKAISRFGTETTILTSDDAGVTDGLNELVPNLGEAVRRARLGHVRREAGFDGQFGVISVFNEAERAELCAGKGITPVPEVVERTSSVGTCSLPKEDSHAASPASHQPAPGPHLTLPECAGSSAPLLDADQLNGLHAGPGPVLLLGGPGTGKSHLLALRVAELLDRGVPPREIVVVTPTRRAAHELTERLHKIRGEGRPPRMDTLSAIGFGLWKKTYGEAPVVLDDEAARRVFMQSMAGQPVSESPNNTVPGDTIPGDNVPDAETLKALFATVQAARMRALAPPVNIHPYTKFKESWNQVDEVDLLVFLLEQLRDSEATEEAGPLGHAHVLVDELHDATPLALDVLTALCPDGAQGFFGAADPGQKIFHFKGAAGEDRSDIRDEAAQRLPQLTTCTLHVNYRTRPRLLAAAAPLAHAATPAMRAHNTSDGDGCGNGTVHLFEAPDAAAEVQWMGQRIAHLLDDGPEGGCMHPGEVAVIVRYSALLEPVTHGLATASATASQGGLPVCAPQLQGFWNDPRMAAILHAAARIHGVPTPADVADALGLPVPAAPHPDFPSEIPDDALASGPQGLAAFLSDFDSRAASRDHAFWTGADYTELTARYAELGGWAGLLNWLHLQSDLDGATSDATCVQVLTARAARGHEFSAVFLPALEEGIWPFAGRRFLSGRSIRPKGDEDEERRLFAKSLLRARREVYVSHAARRELYGRTLPMKKSRLLAALPDEELTRSTLVAHTSRTEEQISLL